MLSRIRAFEEVVALVAECVGRTSNQSFLEVSADAGDESDL